ncbi:acylphosphatase [Kytococcus aerolatus]|uniref:acylphosphatase n=1 Tax=Kytococcus aerolatus TaxID=592308 RepID=A0A212U1Y1_9MICO|nr:acylphosphatase [Kytococcus aerolatus]SNC72150.1 acylphosphatase [Kytococcus aerolatus]
MIDAHHAASTPVRATLFVKGHVQGVGFRWWTRSRALELGLVGHARNMDDGRVEVLTQGEPSAVDRLEHLLREVPSTTARPGRVDLVVRQEGALREGLTGFVER